MSINNINTLAADAIDRYGWTQHEMQDDDGSLCLVGALRHCSPQPGDWLIARAVYRRQRHAEAWNDEKGRTAEEVTAWLREHPITDAEIEAMFGPQWKVIIRLVRKAVTTTDDQAAALDAAWTTADVIAMDAAWTIVRDAAYLEAREDAWANAGFVSWDATWLSGWTPDSNAARDAVWNVAKALVVADLVGQYGLTQEHIEALMRPWVSVMGDPREVTA